MSLLVLLSVGAFTGAVEGDVSDDVKNYVDSFLKKTGIGNEGIGEIKEVDQNNLPKEIDIEKIDKNNVGIYEVNYSKNNQSQKVFVVTYTTHEFEPEKKIETNNIQYLNFGISGISNADSYLNSAVGVVTGSDNGYVMLRSGSVTGVSTSLDLSGEGSAEIKVYKNGQDTGFSNLILSDDNSKKDFDLQSENIVIFDAGDIISVYVKTKGNVQWGDAITLVEIMS